nr:hypothetical protein [Tanacetum cinerariifolium]
MMTSFCIYGLLDARFPKTVSWRDSDIFYAVAATQGAFRTTHRFVDLSLSFLCPYNEYRFWLLFAGSTINYPY